MSTPNTGHLKRARESEILDESADKSMILAAQHKALATNLYRYKRRISQLEINVNGLSEANETLYQSIAAITARVALVSIYLD
jgi:ribosomal protein S11